MAIDEAGAKGPPSVVMVKLRQSKWIVVVVILVQMLLFFRRLL